MKTNGHLPPVWRIVTAFVMTPVVPALINALYEGVLFGADEVWQTFRDGFQFSCAMTLLFAPPAIYLLVSPLRRTAMNFGMAGGVVAALPIAVLVLTPFALGLNKPASSESELSHTMMVNGHATMWYWLEGAKASVLAGVFGVIGGLTFWLIALARREKDAT